ncbi:hypothetical protein CLOP_g16780 [Closterium sp. NIES-67]|nr:hypothetical protein CLOP_g16780 [Closterium sp. NIES-67]
MVESLVRAIHCNRAQASRAVLVLSSPRAAMAPTLELPAGLCACHCTALDCYSDPMGWGQPFLPSCGPDQDNCSKEGSSSSSSSSSFCNVWDLVSLERRILLAAKAPAAEADSAAGQSSPSVVVFDSLDSFLHHNSPAALLALLRRLQWHASVSGLLILSHADVTPPAVTSSLCHMAHALLSLEPHPGHSPPLSLPLSLLLSSPSLPHCSSVSPHLVAGSAAAPGATGNTVSSTSRTTTSSSSSSSNGSTSSSGRGDRHLLPGGILVLQQKRASGKFRTAHEEYRFDSQGAVHIDAHSKGHVSIPEPAPASGKSTGGLKPSLPSAEQQPLADRSHREGFGEQDKGQAHGREGRMTVHDGGVMDGACREGGSEEAAAVEVIRKTGDQAPEVSFRLELSVEERAAREKVVLPYEHRGETGPIKIYDGRRSLAPSHIKGAKIYGEGSVGATVSAGMARVSVGASGGEWNEGGGLIHYERDSDDEYPDSDEDPDDDLDI